MLRTLAARSVDDLRTVKKIARSDFNRLQLSLLRGDPLLAFLRDTLARLRIKLTDEPPPIPAESEQVILLREQFEMGALPRDPLLVRALLEEAQRDPELVSRLVSEAKDVRGVDATERQRP